MIPSDVLTIAWSVIYGLIIISVGWAIVTLTFQAGGDRRIPNERMDH